MTYSKPLPQVHQLIQLAQITPFPTTRAVLSKYAKASHAPAPVIDFLKLFPASAIFRSQADFITRCEELELLIRQEQTTPRDPALSPQD